MSNVVSFQGKKLRINSGRIEYYHEGSNEWMDDGPAPGDADELSVKFGTLYAKGSGIKYKRDQYGGFSPVSEKVKKAKSTSSSSKSKWPLWLRIIGFPLWLIWKIVKFIWKAIPTNM